MAERRMFAKTIIDSDAFLEMPISTQLLYFHLSMRADDDGFLNSPKKIQRMIGCSDDDLKLLIAKNFIIPFESGVVVIKHWKIHNYIQNDRYKPTVYQEEKALLKEKDNKSYTLCIQNGYSLDTQDRIDKDIDRDRVSIGYIYDENSNKETKHKYGEYKNVLLTDIERDKLQEQLGSEFEDFIERLSSYIESKGTKYKSHYATILNWYRKEQTKTKGRNDFIDEW